MNAASLLMMNFRRKRIRTILTMCSFAIALFLFGILAIVDTAFYQGVELAGANRLVIRNKISLIMFLPRSYKERLEKIPGIDKVTFEVWFGGVYQKESNFFTQFAVDTDTYGDMFPEFIIPPDQWKAFVADRQGCIVGQKLAERFGWKIGDRIPLKGTIFQGAWEFNIRGIYQGKRPSDDTTQFWMQYKYLEETSNIIEGMVGWYYAMVKDPDRAVEITRTIDSGLPTPPMRPLPRRKRPSCRHS